MRTGGTDHRSGDDIDELVEARGLAVETWIGQTSGGAYLSALKEDADLGLELLADILSNPAFPEDKIKLAKEEQKAGISRRNDEPMSIAQREAMKVVFGADHPAGPASRVRHHRRGHPRGHAASSTPPTSIPTACTWW